MKNSKIKILPIIGAVALLAGCNDDLELRQIVPGEEIHFGATASFDNGSPQSRTIYGEVINNGNKIQINWVPGEDIIDIAYPEAAQKKLVAYDVLTSEDHTTDPSKSTAQTLAPHKGETMGLQWGTPPDGYHHFYAVYPSSKMFGESELDGSITMDSEGLSGYMPNAQDPKSVNKDTNGNYYIEPDMRYAYMVAQTAHAQNAGDNVTLDFHPLVTALEFTVIAAEVKDNVSDGKMTLQGIRLQSVNKNNICGNFSYKFQNNANYTVTDINKGASGFDQIYMDIPNGIELTKDKKFNFTFFVLPTKKYDPKDLKLTFVYLDNKGNLTYKTAAINKNIEMRKKYFFNNVSLKAISSDAQPSKWFSMLDENIYINQLSIPVAGNAFTNIYTGSDSAYHKQQVADYKTLWNQGVRGFELVTEWASGAAEFGKQHFVGGEKVLTSSPTFDTVVRQLVSFKKSEATKNETLILICHCHPVTCKVNGQSYVTNLMAYFQSLIDDGTLTLDDFVLLSANSTVHNLKGKISIIIRPGDDLYFKWTWKETTSDGTSISKTSDDIDLSGFSIPALLIKDWGSAYDRWDKRYTGAEREATWADAIGATGIRIEKWLYGISTTTEPFTAGTAFSTDPWPAKKVGDSRYQQTTNNGTAFVQEWARVAPERLNNIQFNTGATNAYLRGGVLTGSWKRNKFLWVRWPSSIKEKKDDIDALFAKSILGNNICVNVLSGYYITKQHTVAHKYVAEVDLAEVNPTYDYEMVSAIPFKEKFGNDDIVPRNQGNGGNYAGLAADLNTFVYEKLQNDAYGVGPLGLVQIDFIGATKEQFDAYDTDNYNTNHAAAATASQNLVPFIAMNNFRFPMKRADVQMGTSNEKVDQTIEGE